MAECVFCDIVWGRAPAEFVIAPGEVIGAVAFRPLNPVVPGHVLFVPTTHVRDAAESPVVTAITFRLAAEYADLERRPFNLITSAGAEATQSVLHLHAHYVPRAPGDGLALPWTGQKRRAELAEADR